MLNFLRMAPRAKAAPKKPIAEIVQAVANNDVTLIDVREISEISRTGKAKDALHIPLMSISYRADPRHPEFHAELDPTKPVAIYCATGARSGMAVQTMTDFGFKSVTNIGSLSGWLSAGGGLAR